MAEVGAVLPQWGQELGEGGLLGDHVVLHLGAMEEDGSTASVWGPLQEDDRPSPPREGEDVSSLGEEEAEAHRSSCP